MKFNEYLHNHFNKNVLYELLFVVCLYAIIIHTHKEVMQLSRPWHVIYPTSHVCFLILEGALLYFLSFICPKRRHTIQLIIFIVATIILWINVAYSRYFETYMPLTLYGEFNNLNGLLPDIINSFKINDLFYLFTCSIVCFAYWKMGNNYNSKHSLYLPCILFAAIFISSTYHYYSIKKDYDYISEFFKDIDDNRNTWDIFIDRRNMLANNEPRTCTFYYGIGVSLLWNAIEKFYNSEHYHFSENDIEDINAHYYTTPYSQTQDTVQNIIFILVESLASYPINKTIGGIELTPNINKLLENAYVNLDMTSEAQLGQSSDGQFIYLTGLLPLKEDVTINNISTQHISTFVSLAKEQDSLIHSQMIIPTGEESWSQKSMCSKYGIEELYTISDYPKEVESDWMNDEQLFELAALKDEQLNTPFIKIILTSSMHSPYTMSCEDTNISYPTNFSSEVKHYLDNTHYMDKHLGKYLFSLQKHPWYKNCTIIITADHKPNGPKLNTKEVDLFAKIPLIIINPPHDLKAQMDTRSITQTSLFPTILDILHIKSQWKGCGQSILMPENIRTSTYEKKRYEIREKISNYIISQKYMNK